MSDRPNSPRKRRTRHRYRRHTKAISVAPPPPPGLPLPAGHEERKVRRSKLNPSFVQEEREVRASLERFRDGPLGPGGKPELHEVDREILFFTDTLPDEVFYDAQDHHPSDDPLTTASGNPKRSPPLKSPSSNGEPEDTPTHLASSYFQTDDSAVVVVPWKTQKLDPLDENLLYYQPGRAFSASRTMLKEVRVDSTVSIVGAGEPVDEERGGRSTTFVPPNVSVANKNRLMNRLLEEEREEWFDARGELVDFRQYVGTERVRGFCSKSFAPFYIEPIPLANTVEQLPMERTVKILIGKLHFDAYPTFGDVVRLRLKLEQLYRQYYRIRRLNRTQLLEGKLQELRTQEQNGDGADVDGFQLKMARRELRTLFYQEVRSERTVAKQMLEVWDELKDLQKDCGLKLTVTSPETKEDRDSSELQERFTMELQETLEEEHELYVRDKQEYKAYLRDLELDEAADEAQREPIVKPKKPDPARLRHEFQRLFDETFRSPEAVPFSIVLQRDPEVIDRARQRSAKELQFKAKLFIDGNHVASTKARHFQGDALVDFNTSFAIKLTTKIPEMVAVHLFEKNRLKVKSKRAEIFVPLPSRSELFDDSAFVDYQFSCGKPYKPQTYANGSMELKVGWLEPAGSAFPSPSRRRVVPRHVVLSSEQVQRWVDEQALGRGELDVLMKALELQETGTRSEPAVDRDPPEMMPSEKPGLFRLNEDLLAFCSEDTIERNERLLLLTKRFNRTLKYRDAKFIPQSERELAVVNDEEEAQRKIIDETLGTDPIDLQRHRGKRYLHQVYEIITNHCRVLNQDKVNNNLLLGADQVPTFGTLSLAFLEIFGPRRPLKPSRRSPASRTSVRVTDVTHYFQIVVTIVRAFGIPMRTEDSPSGLGEGRRHSNMSSNGRLSFRSSNVRPYIAVSIKDRVLRTSTADGTAPTWNEQLELPLDVSTDQIRKHLHIDLYDEFMENLLEDDRARPTEMYQRISSRWLGQLRIPISTIYLNQRLEGTFEIKTPPILFGYDRQQQPSPGYQGAPDIQENYGTALGLIGSGASTSLPDMRELTHVSLFISLEPPIERTMLDTGGLECVELDQTRTRISLWYAEYRHEFPARAIVPPMVTLLGGKRICATRLLGPLPIPFAIDERAETMIRRYVSLIPVHHSVDPCSQLGGIWLTNKEILTMMCASPKDLGVLLACFYLGLGYDVFLVLGNSVLIGDTTFVLLLEAGEFFIVDPYSGKKYSSTDTYCPLGRIYLVVGSGNVWGNIQKENRVFLSQLDVRKSGYWRALFNRFNEAPSGCVQEATFQFTEALPARDLQRAIERKLMKKIASWRSHRKTIWNRYVNEQLRSTLVSLDTCQETGSDRHMVENFGQMFVSYKINGFPINMPYTNLPSIVAQVKGTGIHLNSENGVEFALGVYIKDYPCNVYSVWVFLMSLVPRA
ncbi:coiled-coil and C2 domain-containing protein 2A [Anopheles cruzii]|uniref:coiled-coil and C2 domain-containing protein 2A n=1 Tax=Anopheles cruzii TaxID=68878 RepID=UPI0022EC4A00|nr:coiled-coil and C2 domain-containing protein 2A [Anopheles cruzii]